MAATARFRWELRDKLKEMLGMDATNALLDELPDVGTKPATQQDIAEVRTAIADLRSSVRGDIIVAVIAMYTATLAAVIALVVLR
jgi:hypothetical protein